MTHTCRFLAPFFFKKISCLAFILYMGTAVVREHLESSDGSWSLV